MKKQGEANEAGEARPENVSATRRLSLYLTVPMVVLTLVALLLRGYRFGRNNIRCLHDEGAWLIFGLFYAVKKLTSPHCYCTLNSALGF